MPFFVFYRMDFIAINWSLKRAMFHPFDDIVCANGEIFSPRPSGNLKFERHDAFPVKGKANRKLLLTSNPQIYLFACFGNIILKNIAF